MDGRTLVFSEATLYIWGRGLFVRSLSNIFFYNTHKYIFKIFTFVYLYTLKKHNERKLALCLLMQIQVKLRIYKKTLICKICFTHCVVCLFAWTVNSSNFALGLKGQVIAHVINVQKCSFYTG